MHVKVSPIIWKLDLSCRTLKRCWLASHHHDVRLARDWPSIDEIDHNFRGINWAPYAMYCFC